MSTDGQGTKWRRKKHCRKFQPAEYGSRTLQTDGRRQTDGFTTTYRPSERELTSRSLKTKQKVYICLQ